MMSCFCVPLPSISFCSPLPSPPLPPDLQVRSLRVGPLGGRRTRGPLARPRLPSRRRCLHGLPATLPRSPHDASPTIHRLLRSSHHPHAVRPASTSRVLLRCALCSLVTRSPAWIKALLRDALPVGCQCVHYVGWLQSVM